MEKPIFQISESELTYRIKDAVKNEKAASLEMLEYLAEVNQRRLYATQSYSSLYEYVVKELGYTESQASERVQSIRLFQDIPEVKSLLNQGALSMTTAAQIQRFFRNEKKFGDSPLSEEEKRKIISSCENKSKREIEKVLFKLQSDEAKVKTAERVRRVSDTHFEFKFLVPEGVMDQVNEVRNLVGETTLAETFQHALLVYVKALKKGKQADEKLSGSVAFPAKDNRSAANVPENSAKKEKSAEGRTAPSQNCEQKVPALYSRYIPRTMKRMLFARSNGQCEFVDPKSRNRCLSRYRVQIDHIIPHALGGKTEIQNLRHLCQGHNLRSAVEWFPNKKPLNS